MMLKIANELNTVLEKKTYHHHPLPHTPRQQVGSGQGTSSRALEANMLHQGAMYIYTRKLGYN
jgi:hypothetical protein